MNTLAKHADSFQEDRVGCAFHAETGRVEESCGMFGDGLEEWEGSPKRSGVLDGLLRRLPTVFHTWFGMCRSPRDARQNL